MKAYNILVLNAGRRVELIQCFQKAAKKLNIKSNIIAGDCSSTAPAIYFADRYYIFPRISEQTILILLLMFAQKKILRWLSLRLIQIYCFYQKIGIY